MTYNDVERYVKREPFVPIEVVLASGERYQINKREHVTLTRSDLLFGTPSPTDDELPDHFVIRRHVDITEIKDVPARRSKRSGGRKG